MQLYVKFEDDDGHCYLIKKELWHSFDKAHTRIEDALRESKDEDTYYEQLDDVLSYFGATTLEGELHYIVLDSELNT